MMISIIIPVYNLAAYVRETWASVRAACVKAQVSVECIFVDDGSKDGSGALLDEFATEGDLPANVKVRVLHQVNGGEGAARDAGLDVATGEWITYLDGDDVWGEDILVRAEEEIEKNFAADLIAFRLESFEGEWRGGAKHGEGTSVRRDVARQISYEVLMACGVVPTFFRKGVFEGIRFSGLTLGADRLYMAECLCRAKEVVLVDEVEYGYRMRGDSMAHLEWSAKKVGSMLDYAAGALGVFEASGKVLDGEVRGYFGEVMTRLAYKYIRRMKDEGEKRVAQKKWYEVLKDLDVAKMPWKVRLMRAWYLLVAGRMLKGLSK